MRFNGRWLLGPSAIMLLACAPSLSAVKVVATTEDIASITRSVGGDLVDVSFVAKGTQDPHYIDAKPSFCVKIGQADLVVSIGLSLESGWLPLLLRGARKPSLLPGNPGYLEVAEAITPLEMQLNADRSEGDVHPFGNPHFMADPERGIQVAGRIARKLSELDPSNSAAYDHNFSTFRSGLEGKIVDWKRRLAKLSGANVVGYEKTFNYFFKFFKMNPVGFIEPKPGVPPSAQHILSLIQTAKSQKVKLIVMENFFETKSAEAVAKQTGATLAVLPAYTGGDPKCATYEAWLECLVSALDKKEIL